MKQKVPQIYYNVTIVEAVSEGYCIARTDDNLVIFVPYAAPGDIVDIQITHKRKSFKYGKIIKFHSYSPDRVEPFCKYFGLCGGCKWQHLKYQAQLDFKQKQVYDALTRIGKVDVPNINSIIPSTKTQYYRNKLEFTFSDFRWMTDGEYSNSEERNLNGLGFHLPGKFDRIVDIDKCYLQPDPSNNIRNFVRDYALNYNMSFYNIKNHIGLLRNLIIRQSTTGGLMVVLVVTESDTTKFFPLLEELRKKFSEITSLMYVINDKFNDDIFDREVFVYYGDDHLVEKMEKLNFIVGTKSFYQTNHDQAYNLYKIAREFADLNGEEIVYDFYTGTGTIANFIADRAKKVVGIEYIGQAIIDARQNSEFNKIKNTVFFEGDMAKILTDDFIAANGKPDVVITDPPRAGMHQDVVNTLIRHKVPKIVYVSCNPATQARDINMMLDTYKVVKVQPVDMFPHTQHVENVVLLVLK
ncbi:23S rRNA (uracil(1939)-C(5))-methyltransferase RlmD [Bacteroidales bacterium OttesenSCG-928-K03]|nr:23S rRNA (uracil(1939)-C(5))-methyltransferase RlmD [Odoribacter sp. OttesenSCG-928-L07]MDL2242597.1 23S rRNA (uracil(1939)-C(5))-methyltransferase RlmD [Bacteroidales bacterium OttesenSCG-928-K03]